MTFRYLLFFVFAMLFFSCKKEKEQPATITPTELMLVTEKIQQRWNFDVYYQTETVGSTEYHDTILGASGDFFQFTQNGLAYSYWGGIADTLGYGVLDAGRIIYGGDTFSIAALTVSKFEIINQRTTSASSINQKIMMSR